MTDVTQILSQIEAGDPSAADQLLPLVYEELRKLAAARIALEKPGQSLQATALVHEAYLRLVDVEQVQRWDSRGHFFSSAAEAMRRILVENARRKRSRKHGGGRQRVELAGADLAFDDPEIDIVNLSDAIDCLKNEDPAPPKLRNCVSSPVYLWTRPATRAGNSTLQCLSGVDVRAGLVANEFTARRLKSFASRVLRRFLVDFTGRSRITK